MITSVIIHCGNSILSTINIFFRRGRNRKIFQFTIHSFNISLFRGKIPTFKLNFVKNYLEKSMKIKLGLNRGVGVLLSTTSFILDEVLILEIMIEDYSINHHLHLLRRSLLKYFSNTTRVQYLPPN